MHSHLFGSYLLNLITPLMMRRKKRLSESLGLPSADLSVCQHPLPILLWKLDDSDVNVYRCRFCGELIRYVCIPNEEFM